GRGGAGQAGEFRPLRKRGVPQTPAANISLVTRKSPAPARSQINVSRYGPYRSWPISLNGELARKPRASMRNVVSESRRPLGPRRGVFMVTPGASVILVV